MNYEHVYQKLDERGVISTLALSEQPVIIHSLKNDIENQWTLVFDDNFHLTYIFNMMTNECAKKENIDQEAQASFEEFLEDIDITEKELIEYSKLFYENDHDKAFGGME